jgi:hypothetical protein
LLCFASAQRGTKIYHHNLSHSAISDGEIDSSNLRAFFVKDEDIRTTTSPSRGLATELRRVKHRLAETATDTTIDYTFYDYAFILPSQDTLYTDSQFYQWRSDTKRGRLASPIKAYVSTAFAR